MPIMFRSLGAHRVIDYNAEDFTKAVSGCDVVFDTVGGDVQARSYGVLRPGGRFILVEHVRSPVRVVRAVERAIEPLTVRFEGDHLTREPLDHLEPVGFRIEQLERSKWGIVERVSALKLA